ncbi:MAG TPA: aminotransferase class I/II-fold pyridoxal phosphate-dependent enzyme, partial [Chitinophagaceae bacterium]|nr:aminotransferase class I/II-fold pyridoxal phosphate-dependent enzyme [Chitinophagaceae bacterium]
MLEKIKALEKAARPLEPAAPKRGKTAQAVLQYAEAFLRSLRDRPAYVKEDDGGSGLGHYPPQDKPRSLKQVLSLIGSQLDTPGLNPASGGHLGYIPGGGLYDAALGDLLAAVTNRYATVFYASPGAVRMENLLIHWMCRLVGYPGQSSGYLSSGGSMANLSAIVAARDAKGITSKNIRKSVIYFTAQAHHCIDKAIRIAGLSECIHHEIPMNKRFQMDAGQLEEKVASDLAKGLHPWLVVASAGTTDVGAIDPLEKIAAVAEKHHLWYHVDAAYGGFFILTPKGKRQLKGIARADSIVMDPHKGLFLPYGSGALLIRDRGDLARSFHYQAGYMQDTVDADQEISPADISPELSRHFRGLRLWLPLQLNGLKPFRAALEEKVLLAQYFFAEIKKLGFEAPFSPELTVVIYRFIPQKIKGDQAAINAFNEGLVKAVQDDGRVFISST